jgi:hypothetical protein
MHTIKLKVSEKVYENFLWLLKRFREDEVEIIHEDPGFYETKKQLEGELAAIKKGEANFSSLEEADQRLEETIRKHEDPS